jgi:hypothetical protein
MSQMLKKYFSYIELEGRDGDPGRGSGAGQPNEVLAANVAGKQRRAHLGSVL